MSKRPIYRIWVWNLVVCHYFLILNSLVSIRNSLVFLCTDSKNCGLCLKGLNNLILEVKSKLSWWRQGVLIEEVSVRIQQWLNGWRRGGGGREVVVSLHHTQIFLITFPFLIKTKLWIWVGWDLAELLEQRVLKFVEDQAFLRSYDLAPPPVSKLSLFLCLYVCRRSSYDREGGGAKSYDREKVWPSIKHSILSFLRWSTKVATVLGSLPASPDTVHGIWWAADEAVMN
jgi:hypothetical protein